MLLRERVNTIEKDSLADAAKAQEQVPTVGAPMSDPVKRICSSRDDLVSSGEFRRLIASTWGKRILRCFHRVAK